MIVVDADVIAAFWIRSVRTPFAINVRRKDANWIAPILWRSEFRSVLRQYMMADHMAYSDAARIMEKAERSMRGKEYAVESAEVLKHVDRTDHSSYDCEYVALAEALGLRLVTGDKKLVRLFPNIATLLEDFAR